MLALSVAWQAYIQDAPHLYVTAAIALVFKAIIIPVSLHRIIVRLGIHREIEKVVGVGPAMKEQYGVYVGEYVTVGHNVTLHGSASGPCPGGPSRPPRRPRRAPRPGRARESSTACEVPPSGVGVRVAPN